MHFQSSLILLGSLPAALTAPLPKLPSRNDTALTLGTTTESAAAKRQLAGIPIIGELAPEILAFITRRGLGEGLLPRDTTLAKRQLEGIPFVGQLAPEILALITGGLGGGLLPRNALNPAAVLGAAISALTDPLAGVFGGKTGAGGGSNIPAFLQELGNGGLNKRDLSDVTPQDPAVQNGQLKPAAIVGATISALTDPFASTLGGKSGAGGGSNIPAFLQELEEGSLNRRDPALQNGQLNPAAVVGAAVSSLTDPIAGVFGAKTGAGGGSDIPAFLQELGNGDLDKRDPGVQSDQLNPVGVVGAAVSALSDPLANGFGGKTGAGGGSDIPAFVQELGSKGFKRRDSNIDARHAKVVGLLGPVATSLLPLGGDRAAGPRSSIQSEAKGAGNVDGLSGALAKPLKDMDSSSASGPLSIVDGVTKGTILPRAAGSKGDDLLLTILGAVVAATTDPVAPLFGGVQGAGGPSSPLDLLKLLGMVLGGS